MKTKIKYLFAIGLAVGLVFSAGAAGLGNPAKVIDSTRTTNGVVNFPAWPIILAGAVNTTNFTLIDISSYKEVSLQFTCASTNTTTTSNVVWTIYKTVSQGPLTNAVGTNTRYDLLGQVTNTLNGTTAVTTVATYTATPRTTGVANQQSSDPGIAGVQSLIVGYATTLTLGGVTNYQVYVGGK